MGVSHNNMETTDHACYMGRGKCSICQQAQQELQFMMANMKQPNFFFFKPILRTQTLETVVEEVCVSSGVKLGSVVSGTATVGAGVDADGSETVCG